MRNFVFFIVLLFTILNFAFWFLAGMSSVLLTISIYILLLYISNEFFKRNINFKLFFNVLIISLLISEIALKYVLKNNLSYSERNGGFFYVSPFKKII